MYVRKASPMTGEHDSADLACADITRKLQVHDPSGMDALPDLVRRRTPSAPATLASHLRTAINEIQPRVGRAGISPQPAKTAEAREVLAELDESEREALLRFYVREQQPAQICRELGLTEQAFFALKSRVRAKYRELTRGTMPQ
jgi:DNA-directed RNA polymerase specialized sigma24 family protein